MLRWTSAGAIGLLLAGGLAPSVAAEGAKRRVVVGQKGRLGVSLAEVESGDVARLKLKEETGARVRDVVDGSPAAAAGLKEDDVILRFQGEPVHSASQLARLVRETPAGRKVALEISRDGATQQVTATLGESKGFAMADLGNLEILPPELPEMPDMPALPEIPEVPAFRWSPRDHERLGEHVGEEVARALRSRGPRLGIRYHELSDQLAGYFKVEDGVLVSSVDEDSPAARAGLRAGDVIVKLDGRKVADASDLGQAVARMEPGVEATLTVQRDGRPLDLKVTVAGARSRRVPKGPTT